MFETFKNKIMSDPRESFSSDHILENYQHLNEIDWLRDEEEETEYPRNQSAVSENKVVVDNNNGIFNCQNDLWDENKL